MAIKAAAKSLVDIVMPDNLTDKDTVKVAIVPFEGQVNVASAGFDVTAPPSWIEWSDAGNCHLGRRQLREAQHQHRRDLHNRLDLQACRATSSCSTS